MHSEKCVNIVIGNGAGFCYRLVGCTSCIEVLTNITLVSEFIMYIILTIDDQLKWV